MNKKTFIDVVLKESERQLKESNDSLKRIKQAARDAPGPMQSKSDTSKHQLSQLASNIESGCNDIKKLIASLKLIDTNKVYDKIQIGAIVELKENNNAFLVIVLPSGGGGQTVEAQGCKIETISFASPMAQALLNKQTGDVVKVKIPAGIRVLSVLNVM